jgi:cellulose biosynthesis protein BcsQ
MAGGRSAVLDASDAAGPGVIVVAEQPLHDLLASAGVPWRIQERQSSVAAMWEALSGGRLDQHSRILVFSDSLMAGSADDESERLQTARAVVAMSHAGAYVFVALWRPELEADFEQLIARAAAAQSVDPGSLGYRLLPVDAGGRATLDAMRAGLGATVTFPDAYAPSVDGPLARDVAPAHVAEAASVVAVDLAALESLEEAEVPEPPAPVAAPVAPVTPPEPVTPRVAAPPAAAGPPGRPSMPPIGGATQPSAAAAGGEYPPSASLELLQRPKLPGQTTITVTSSKGGSGKSTASILLAGSIARASADAGRPLSVCLIDLDTRDGQVASLIGKFMPTALNIRVQPVWDEERIRRNLVHADGLGIDTLLAPIRPRTADTVGPDFYRTIVRSLQRMYDVVIMDTSVQYLEPLIAEVALGEADEILFVTTLASTAVQGMARALREITAPLDESGLGIPREKIGIIVNQSVANVGMERDQVLAAGLGVPVVGVIPLATKDVLTATNLNRMYALLDHPLLGPAYNELGRACLPGRDLGTWHSTAPAEPVPAGVAAGSMDAVEADDAGRKRGLFRR